MATRSTIAIEYADGTVDKIYCHYDGYIDGGVGKMLIEHYIDPFKVRELMDHGDLSSLGEVIGEKHPFSSFGMSSNDYFALYGKMSTFYARDRGDTNCSARRFKSFEEYQLKAEQQEYNYILRCIDCKPVWFVREFSENVETLL
jgi:hypothetical protein